MKTPFSSELLPRGGIAGISQRVSKVPPQLPSTVFRPSSQGEQLKQCSELDELGENVPSIQLAQTVSLNGVPVKILSIIISHVT